MSTTLEPKIAGLDRASLSPAAGRGAPRIYYAAGNGDLMGTYRHWKQERDDPSQLSMTYSGQFFDLCRRLGCEGFVLSHDAKIGFMHDGRMTIRQRPPMRYGNGPGALYHLEQFFEALRIIVSALRFRADVVVPASGACHWFPLAVLPLLGIKVVPALHCVLWPKYRRPGRLARMITALDRVLFVRAASALLTASRDIDEQLVALAGRRVASLPIIPFLPTYRSEHFSEIVAAPASPPFRVLYAGRVVPEKGVFDLLKIAETLGREGGTPIEFDVCGTGSALEEMKQKAQAAGIGGRMRFHGHCDRPTMVSMFQNCHVVIVPTTTGFVEGFNQVVAEGILAGRPVVTSDVCPAIKYVGDAVVAVPPDDADAYGKALKRLAEEPTFYQRAAAACGEAREQFFDESRGWGAALESAIHSAVPEFAG